MLPDPLPDEALIDGACRQPGALALLVPENANEEHLQLLARLAAMFSASSCQAATLYKFQKRSQRLMKFPALWLG